MNSWTSPVDIRPDHLEIVQEILRAHLSAGFKVWVFGSRANWTTKDSSDLDLAVEGAVRLDHKSMIGLEVAFEESDLPYTVDVVDLKAVSSGFRQIVENQRLSLPHHDQPGKDEWETASWGDLATLEYGKSLRGYESSEGPYRVYGTNGPIGWCNEPLCFHPSVIIGRKGAYRGVHYSATPFFVIDTAFYLRPKVEIDTRWAYYQLLTQDINGMDSGSAIPSTSREDFYGLPVKVPPLAKQRAITRVLGTLDDKIELNRQMNRTLEEMARGIFQDWFVDFGPTRAKMDGLDPYLPPELWGLFPDELVNSELGEIPEGWKVETLSTYSSLNPESWTKKNFPDDIEYVDLANTKWGTITSTQHFPRESAPSRARRVLRAGDTVIGTVRPGNGSFSLVGRDNLTGSTGFAVLRPIRQQFRELIYLAASNPDNIERLTHRADGGAYPAVRPEVVAESQVVSPVEGTDLLDRFSDLISPLLDKMESNQTETRSLMALRNEMLPSLISGELKLESN